eukprot:2178452-Rhodomonas_salina.2
MPTPAVPVWSGSSPGLHSRSVWLPFLGIFHVTASGCASEANPPLPHWQCHSVAGLRPGHGLNAVPLHLLSPGKSSEGRSLSGFPALRLTQADSEAVRASEGRSHVLAWHWHGHAHCG